MKGLAAHLLELEPSLSMDLLNQVGTFCSRMILVGTKVSNPIKVYAMLNQLMSLY